MAKLKNAQGKSLTNANGQKLYYGELTQLDTPTELQVSNTTASWREVDNATAYEFFVDGVSIGTYNK